MTEHPTEQTTDQTTEQTDVAHAEETATTPHAEQSEGQRQLIETVKQIHRLEESN